MHAETSTGVASDAKSIAALAQKHGAMTIMDAVTSLAGVPVLLDEWGIDACYAASQKCLSCTPGLAPISFSDRVVDLVRGRTEKVHSFFMDLSLLLGYWGATTRTYHHTPPCNSLYALHESLLMLQEEGLENSWARHERNHKALRAGLETFGLSFLVEEKDRLPQMNAVHVLPGIDEKEVRRRLLLDYNLEIGAGLGDLAGKIWRFGIMGYSCRMENVMLCLCALETVFADMGVDVRSARRNRPRITPTRRIRRTRGSRSRLPPDDSAHAVLLSSDAGQGGRPAPLFGCVAYDNPSRCQIVLVSPAWFSV